MAIYEREDDHDQTEFPESEDRPSRKIEGKGEKIGCCVIGLVKGEKKAVTIASKPILADIVKHDGHAK